MMNLIRHSPLLATFILVLSACIPIAEAQYPPQSAFSTILQSHLNSKITVAYKQPPADTCKTAFVTQKQYTGYITLPPFTLAPIQQDYTINTFFWFVEARQTPETAPLTIWLNGGPGTSSMFGLFNEVGPCEVVQLGDGSYGTKARQWGWDRSTNILFIDQPNQVGFSYDKLTNASYDLLHEELFEPPKARPSSLPSFMYLNGTFGSGSEATLSPGLTTANTTEIAAQAVWHFLQTWLSAFPQYNPATRPNVTALVQPTAAPASTATSTTTGTTASASPVIDTAGIHLFSESYGGKYGPAFAAFFEDQNTRLANGALLSNSTIPIKIETVGIINGIIDDLIQDRYYPYFGYNNTYGIQAISQADELNAISRFNGPCTTAINACRTSINSTDAEGHGDSGLTNYLCQQAQNTCADVSAAYYNAGGNPYDIRSKLPSPDPPAAYQEYLNSPGVLAAVGARINFTQSNRYVQEGFLSTGDTIRGGLVDDLAYLISRGVRVALLYGDADYICNWYGGQAISLAIANLLPTATAQQVLSGMVAPAASYASSFPAAGYAEIVVNSSYVGGAVRQYGNLSFSRIYDAGHTVPYYQPETAFTVFARIVLGTDISTGKVIDPASFSSSGPMNATHSNAAPPAPSQTCWVRSFNASCTSEDLNAMLAGKGVVAHGIYYQDAASVSLPASTSAAGTPDSSTNGNSTASSRGSGTTSSVGLTGVYTASGTPTPTGAALTTRAPEGSVLVLALLPMLLLCAGITTGIGRTFL